MKPATIRKHERSAIVCFTYARNGRTKWLLSQCHIWLFRAAGVPARWMEPA